MKRRSRRARQDEFTRQRSRMNETRMNFLWGLDEVNHVSDSLSCDEGIYQRERLLQNVYLLQNLKDDVPGPTARFRSPYTLETRSLRSYNPDSHLEKRQEGDRYIKHRRSVSNESLFLESTAIRSGMSKFSPLQNLDIYDDLNLSQCSDSAFSDTELETDSKHVNGTTRATLKEMDKQIRQSPMTNIRLRHYAASPLYDKPSGQLRSPSRCASVYLDRSPALSRSKSTSDSCACSLDHGINCSDRIHLDRNTPCSVITRNRSRSRWRPSCRSHDIIKSLLLKNMKLEVNPGSKTVVTPSRMQSQICQRDAQCKGCAERMKAWELLSPKSACKSKISKRNDNFSLDGDDYDGDVSFRSLNEPPTATFSERNTTTMDYESPYNSIEATVCRSLSAVNGTAYLQQNLLSPMQPTMTAMRRSIDDPEDEVDCASPVMINIPASYKLNKRIAGDEQMEGNTLKAQQQGPLDASSRSEDVSTHDGKPGTFESFKDMECIPSWMKKQLVHRDTACFPPSMSRSCSGREASDAMMESSRSTPTKARVEKHEVTEGGDKGNDYESFAMVKSTTNPGQDFKESMMEMVLHKRLHDSFQLVELLQCYLSLNSAVYHDVIVKAFIELWSELFNPDK
ncbi:hypothetical protein KP509_11G011500 [Ceratopteris richardii]|nr:hypothetical protein KP509_11G011500 [Ceratopteris richardii]